MKTAMEQLIEYTLSLKDDNKTRMEILSKADLLLSVEKQQIINAWIADDNELQRIEAEKYYEKTYKK